MPAPALAAKRKAAALEAEPNAAIGVGTTGDLGSLDPSGRGGQSHEAAAPQGGLMSERSTADVPGALHRWSWGGSPARRSSRPPPGHSSWFRRGSTVAR